MIEIGLQVPYSMIIGWESFFDKDQTKLPFKSFAVYLLLITVEIKWDLDE
jgi:hypothetical protein